MLVRNSLITGFQQESLFSYYGTSVPFYNWSIILPITGTNDDSIRYNKTSFVLHI